MAIAGNNDTSNASFSCELFFELPVGIPSSSNSTNAIQALYYLRNKGQVVAASAELNLHFFSIFKARNESELGGLELQKHLSGGDEDILDIINIPQLIENDSADNGSSDIDSDNDGDGAGKAGRSATHHFRLAIVTNSSHVKILSDNFDCNLLFGHKDIVLAACASPDG